MAYRSVEELFMSQGNLIEGDAYNCAIVIVYLGHRFEIFSRVLNKRWHAFQHVSGICSLGQGRSRFEKRYLSTLACR